MESSLPNMLTGKPCGDVKKSKSRGQLAFEAHVKRYPLYHDGTPRRSWDQLDSFQKMSWEHPPRKYSF